MSAVVCLGQLEKKSLSKCFQEEENAIENADILPFVGLPEITERGGGFGDRDKFPI